MTQAILVREDWTYSLCQVDTLADYQKAVGGYIELVPLGTGFGVGYINETGKIDSLPINSLATLYWRASLGFNPNDILCGPMLILGPPDADGNDTDCDIQTVSATLDKIRSTR